MLNALSFSYSSFQSTDFSYSKFSFGGVLSGERGERSDRAETKRPVEAPNRAERAQQARAERAERSRDVDAPRLERSVARANEAAFFSFESVFAQVAAGVSGFIAEFASVSFESRSNGGATSFELEATLIEFGVEPSDDDAPKVLDAREVIAAPVDTPAEKLVADAVAVAEETPVVTEIASPAFDVPAPDDFFSGLLAQFAEVLEAALSVFGDAIDGQFRLFAEENGVEIDVDAETTLELTNVEALFAADDDDYDITALFEEIEIRGDAGSEGDQLIADLLDDIADDFSDRDIFGDVGVTSFSASIYAFNAQFGDASITYLAASATSLRV